MSESVVADFVGRFFAPGMEGDPPTGRVILSQRRLVLAADGYKETIPLSRVFDVAVGQILPEMAGYFSDTVTLAYRRDETRTGSTAPTSPEGDPSADDDFLWADFTRSGAPRPDREADGRNADLDRADGPTPTGTRPTATDAPTALNRADLVEGGADLKAIGFPGLLGSDPADDDGPER